MRALRVAVSGVLIMGILLLASQAAVSQAGGDCLKSCGSGESRDGSVTSKVWQTVPGGGSSTPVSRAPAWLRACSWTLYQPGEAVPNFEADAELPSGGGTVDVATWVVTCPTSTLIAVGFGDPRSGVLEIFPDGAIPPQLVDAVINEAADQVPIIAFYPTSAPDGTVEIPMITRFPTVFWIEDEQWQPVSATASIPPLSVTVTATPVSTVWSGGDDPEEVECDQGVPVRTDVEWEDNDFDCSMLYHHSTNVADNELTLTVTWEVSYECSAVCGTGVLPSQEVTSTRAVRVGEIQALVTAVG